jgi:hypothetical protein
VIPFTSDHDIFSDVLDVYPTMTLQTSFLMAVHDAYIISQAWNLPSGTKGFRLHKAFDDLVNNPRRYDGPHMFVFEPLSNRCRKS